mmetsp:Transcript_60761/g.131909  ORF Transcript_60761/g.131909 Transcript_60761/m.131909 type:complete len:344 (+) Transcript_60761:575-1606(+)
MRRRPQVQPCHGRAREDPWWFHRHSARDEPAHSGRLPAKRLAHGLRRSQGHRRTAPRASGCVRGSGTRSTPPRRQRALRSFSKLPHGVRTACGPLCPHVGGAGQQATPPDLWQGLPAHGLGGLGRFNHDWHRRASEASYHPPSSGVVRHTHSHHVQVHDNSGSLGSCRWSFVGHHRRCIRPFSRHEGLGRCCFACSGSGVVGRWRGFARSALCHLHHLCSPLRRHQQQRRRPPRPSNRVQRSRIAPRPCPGASNSCSLHHGPHLRVVGVLPHPHRLPDQPYGLATRQLHLHGLPQTGLGHPNLVLCHRNGRPLHHLGARVLTVWLDHGMYHSNQCINPSTTSK